VTLRLSMVAAAVAVAAMSLSTLPIASADQGEDYFLQELRRTNQKWYWPLQEDYILGVGHGVCDRWAAGSLFPEQVDAAALTQHWTVRNARYFVSLATRALCPQYYLEKIPPEFHWPTKS
jgi:hypothetical protein